MCSQTYLNHSHGPPIPVTTDYSYSQRQSECPPRVWFSPEIDTSMFILHILPDTPGGCQQLNYSLLSLVSNKLLQLFQDYMTRQAHLPSFLKFILMLNIAHTSIRITIYMWNTILFIFWNRTLHNTTNILLPTILLTHCSFILHRTLQSLYIMISSWAYLVLKM